MNTIDITPIVNAALALIGAGVSVFLIPWLKSQTTESQRKELTREGSTMTINDVPKKLRKQVEDAIAALEAATNAGTAEEGATE